MRTHILLFVALVLAAGCRAEQPAYAPVTDVPPRAVRFLDAAQAARATSDFATALALADSAVAVAPGWPAGFFRRGDLLTDLNQFAAADSDFVRVLALDPHYRGAWFKRGHLAVLQGRYEQAVAHYERERSLIEAGSGASHFYADVDRTALPNVLLQLGRANVLLGQPDAARRAYRASLDADSTRAQAWAWLAELDEEAGEQQAALAHFQRALTLEPFNLDYRYEVGRLLGGMDRAEEGLPLLGSVVRSQPWHAGATYNLGRVLLRLGEAAQARPLLARADTLQILQQEIDQALAAAYQQPSNPYRWMELGGLYIRSGRYDEAEDAMGAALHLAPANVALRNDAANLALARGDTALALARYRTVLAVDSTHADVWLNLGVLHATRGAYGEARTAWHAALRHAPGHAEAKAYLARLPAGS